MNFPTFEMILSVLQAGCWTDQILTLTIYIKKGFQERMKTYTVFVDLSSGLDILEIYLQLKKVLAFTSC